MVWPTQLRWYVISSQQWYRLVSQFAGHLGIANPIKHHYSCQDDRYCYTSQQTYVEVNDTYSEGGTHEETLRPQSKARVMNKRQGD